MAAPDSRADRIDARISLFAPAVATGLTRCWTTNISAGGVGLTALLATGANPQSGQLLALELMLGETKQTIRATGQIAWTSLIRPDGRIGLGLRFTEMTDANRAALALFLAEHRPRAIIALAPPSQRQLAREALGDLHLEFLDDEREVHEEMLRSCASIIVFSDDGPRVKALLDRLTTQRPDRGVFPGDEPLPPVTLCTSLDSDQLLPLLTAGRVYEVLRPPVDRRTLHLAIERSCERWALQVELRWATLQLEGTARVVQARPDRPHALPRTSSRVVRVSAGMKQVYELVATVASHDVPVLLTGETGTGKELAAREVHALSKRSTTPFVAQDCGALTETLLESELFGHVRGAFTGATTDHPGLFQIADGGTIFLDEIQNTSPALQAKLLRVIEEGEVRPVGSAKARRVDVRLIAACNVDIRQAVKDQRFRADFFYRLNRFPIELPPLRHRMDDVLPLTRFFIARMSEELDRPLHRLDARAERALLGYDFPGNIRELRNAIERAILLTPSGQPIRWDVLPAEIRGDAPQATTAAHGLDAQVDEFERRIIKLALDRHAGVIRRAARALHVNAVTLSRKMRRLGLATGVVDEMRSR